MVLFNVFSPSSEPPPPANAPITVKTAGVDVRLGFLRKVYSLLTVNFLITIGISCAFAFVTPIKDYVVDNSWPIYASIAVSLAILLVLLCVPLKFPVNLLVMYVFVFAYSSMVGVIVARYYDRGWGSVVLMAFFATLAIFLSITAYIMVTKKDFSFLHGFLFAGLIALFVVSLLAYLISWPSQNNKINRTLRFIISVGGVRFYQLLFKTHLNVFSHFLTYLTFCAPLSMILHHLGIAIYGWKREKMFPGMEEGEYAAYSI